MFLCSWVKRHLAVSTLFLILLSLCLANFTPGTYLTGWDNLMPELNIWLNLKRSLFALWQEYQGLGLVGGMAHAADLIRQLIILPFTLFLPTNLIRYLWHFAMLFLGTFGIFYLLRKNKFSSLISFTSALFYLLNFGSIQYFWVPLESFSTFWGFFPWLIYFLINYLLSPTKNNLKKLLLINLLATTSFYVQTIFIVYLICIFLVLISNLLFHSRANKLKNSIKIIFLFFLINSFWLFPQIYFLKNNLQNPVAGIGNYMSNEETFARNQARGNLSDFLLLRGYYFDFSSNGRPLMSPWLNHFSNQYFLICGYFLSAFIILGLIYLLSRPKKLNLLSTSLIFFFLLSCLALLSNLPPFKELNSLIRSLPLLNQIFRSPWTKFLVPAAFTFSLLLAYALQFLSNFLRQIKYSKYIFNLPYLLVLFFLIAFSSPTFTGNYISTNVRQKIPNEYFEIFNFLKTQNHTGRIANLPQGSFWGWTNYKWGLSGSGFLWYALENPILDRAFDAWNLKNEQYYWELSTALQSKDSLLLENVFSKYSVEYVLFDNNIYFPDDKIYAKLSHPTKELLDSIPSLKLIKSTQNISLYQTKYPTQIYQTSSLSSTSPFNFALVDQNYQHFGDYLSTSNSTQTFTNLFTNRLQSELSFDPQKFISQSDPLANQDQTHSDLSQPIFAYNFPHASLSQSYLVKINSRHLSGLPLKISAVSTNSQNKYFDTLLPSTPSSTSCFFIPARQSDNFDSGLNFIFNNTFFTLPNQNYIDSITLYPVNTKLPSSSPTLSRQYLPSKSNIFYYQTKINSPSSYLLLPQSYDQAWTAFNFDNFKIKFLTHHQTNNWANAWDIQNISHKNIYILFWPQLLEFIGFGLLIAVIFSIFRHR